MVQMMVALPSKLVAFIKPVWQAHVDADVIDFFHFHNSEQIYLQHDWCLPVTIAIGLREHFVVFWIVDGRLLSAPPVPPSQFRSYRQKTEVLSRGSRETLAWVGRKYYGSTNVDWSLLSSKLQR